MAAQRKLSGTGFAARRRHGKRAAVLACALERGERLRGGASRQTARGSAERASRAQATCGRRPWLGARARGRGRGRGVGGLGSMKRLRERSELACERDKDNMGRDARRERARAAPWPNFGHGDHARERGRREHVGLTYLTHL